MTVLSPIRRSLLEAHLLNADDESSLTIGKPNQTLTLELINRSRHSLVFGDSHGTAFVLTLRPGAFDRLEDLSVTSPGWTLTPALGREFPQLVLTCEHGVSLAPAQGLRITLAGVVPSASGGARSTRLGLDYSNIHVPGGTPLAGRRTLHLALLHEVAFSRESLGTVARAGAVQAEIVSSSDVIRGQADSVLRLRLTALQKIGLAPDAIDDAAPRIHVSFPHTTGDDLRFDGTLWSPPDAPTPWWNWEDGGNVLHITNTASFPFRMLKVDQSGTPIIADTITVGSRSTDALIAPGDTWQIVDNMGAQYIITDARSGAWLRVIRDIAVGSDNVFSFDGTRVSGGKWATEGHASLRFVGAPEDGLSGQFLECDLALTSNLLPGLYPITLRYENFGDQDGEIALFVNVSGIGLPGINASVARINANLSLEVNTPFSRLNGTVDVRGPLSVSGVLSAGKVTASGTLDVSKKTSLKAGLSVTGATDMSSSLSVSGETTLKATSRIYGHVYLSAYEGMSRSGTAYLQARNNSSRSSIGLRLRTQKSGSLTDAMHIMPDGKVGVGTNSPKHKLHVKGHIYGGSMEVGGTLTGHKLRLAHKWTIEITRGGTQMLFCQDDEVHFVINNKGKFWGKG